MSGNLIVGGLVPLTSTDFPGCLSAVLFCQGCPWRCDYCHNPHLIPPVGSAPPLAWPEILAFLHRRRGLLDAVVFSGGEPTLQAALSVALREVRAMGFKTGLHTAAPYPARLAELLPDLDWVGLDIKDAFENYDAITGVPGSGEKAREGAQRVLDAGIAHEFRTTLHPRRHTPDSLLRLARTLAEMGVQRYALQEFRPLGCADAGLVASVERPLLDDSSLVGQIGSLFPHFSVRRA